jgi:hypothetical protein
MNNGLQIYKKIDANNGKNISLRNKFLPEAYF